MTFYFNSCLTEAYQYVVRLLRNWYTDQKLSARWNSQKSYSFRVSNGVRQGGVLSPVLFTSYIDKLLLELRQQGVGCYWNSHFAGAYAYADNLAILAPSVSVFRQMLKCCECFASTHGLKFNPAKTQLVKFSVYAASSPTPPVLSSVACLLNFPTLLCILVVFYSPISVTLKIYCINAGTW